MFGQKPPMSGTEALLKSLGLGEIIEAAKGFANAGTMQKILDFANNVEGLPQAVEDIRNRLDSLDRNIAAIARIVNSESSFYEPISEHTATTDDSACVRQPAVSADTSSIDLNGGSPFKSLEQPGAN